MMDFHRNANPAYRLYIRRAQELRAQAFSQWFSRLFRYMWRLTAVPAVAVSRGYQRRKAELELQALDDMMLKDIGLSRGEIGFAVRAATPSERRESGRSNRLAA